MTGLWTEHVLPRLTDKMCGVGEVHAVEPSDVAWRIARSRVGATVPPITRVGLDGQRLELADSSHDSALSTFTMCTIPDLDAALREIHRVLRLGGALHFVEHGRAPDEKVARWQDRLQPIQKRVAGGCHLDRLIGPHVEACGLTLESIDTFYAPGPRPLGYLYLGVARKRRS